MYKCINGFTAVQKMGNSIGYIDIEYGTNWNVLSKDESRFGIEYTLQNIEDKNIIIMIMENESRNFKEIEDLYDYNKRTKYICDKDFYATMYTRDGFHVEEENIRKGEEFKLLFYTNILLLEKYAYIIQDNEGRVFLIRNNEIRNFTTIKEDDVEYNVTKLDRLREDYTKNYLMVRTCANCEFCDGHIGKSNKPFLCKCKIAGKTFLFDKAKRCFYFSKISYAEWKNKNTYWEKHYEI